MRFRLGSLVLPVVLALGGLATLPACEPPAPPIAPGAPMSIGPMTLIQRNATPPTRLVELKPDGSIVGGSGDALGKVQGTKIVDAKGADVLTIGPDGTVKFAGMSRKLKFTSDGEVTDDKGTIRIGRDGVVITVDANGDIQRTPLQWEAGYNVANRRTAIAILIVASSHLGKVVDLGVE